MIQRVIYSKATAFKHNGGSAIKTVTKDLWIQDEDNNKEEDELAGEKAAQNDYREEAIPPSNGEDSQPPAPDFY